MRASMRIERTDIRPPETDCIFIGTMPLRKNVPAPGSSDWQLKTCPHCGRECWYQAEHAETLKLFQPNIKFFCTECALTAGIAASVGK